jgi:hypothetical protein
LGRKRIVELDPTDATSLRVALPFELLENFDKSIQGEFSSRSEAVRALIKEHIKMHEGGVEIAGKTPPMVYVRYSDHVIFRNVEDPKKFKPAVRDTIGFIEQEDEKYIRITWERPVRVMPFERDLPPTASGLVLLKSTIIKRRNLE